LITAKNLKYFSNLPPEHLTAIAVNSGYPCDRFESAEFLGLTNAGQFCYSATFTEDGEIQKTKAPDNDKFILDTRLTDPGFGAIL